jgi:hypothetical protein
MKNIPAKDVMNAFEEFRACRCFLKTAIPMANKTEQLNKVNSNICQIPAKLIINPNENVKI